MLLTAETTVSKKTKTRLIELDSEVGVDTWLDRNIHDRERYP